MRARARFAPDRPAALEPRTVPSTMVVTTQPSGTVDGYALQVVRKGIDLGEQITAKGTLSGLGQVAISATLTDGRPTSNLFPFSGKLVVREAGGTLRLQVSGVRTPTRQSPLNLDYMIVGGTGRERGATGFGTILLTENPTPLKGHAAYLPAQLTFSPTCRSRR